MGVAQRNCSRAGRRSVCAESTVLLHFNFQVQGQAKKIRVCASVWCCVWPCFACPLRIYRARRSWGCRRRRLFRGLGARFCGKARSSFRLQLLACVAIFFILSPDDLVRIRNWRRGASARQVFASGEAMESASSAHWWPGLCVVTGSLERYGLACTRYSGATYRCMDGDRDHVLANEERKNSEERKFARPNAIFFYGETAQLQCGEVCGRRPISKAAMGQVSEKKKNWSVRLRVPQGCWQGCAFLPRCHVFIVNGKCFGCTRFRRQCFQAQSRAVIVSLLRG